MQIFKITMIQLDHLDRKTNQLLLFSVLNWPSGKVVSLITDRLKQGVGRNGG